jgi:hypothetical protein
MMPASDRRGLIRALTAFAIAGGEPPAHFWTDAGPDNPL